MATEHQMEVLNDALSAFQRAEVLAVVSLGMADPRAEIRAVNRLFDALIAIDGYDATSALPTDRAMAERAAELVTGWLVRA